MMMIPKNKVKKILSMSSIERVRASEAIEVRIKYLMRRGHHRIEKLFTMWSVYKAKSNVALVCRYIITDEGIRMKITIENTDTTTKDAPTKD